MTSTRTPWTSLYMNRRSQISSLFTELPLLGRHPATDTVNTSLTDRQLAGPITQLGGGSQPVCLSPSSGQENITVPWRRYQAASGSTAISHTPGGVQHHTARGSDSINSHTPSAATRPPEQGCWQALQTNTETGTR